MFWGPAGPLHYVYDRPDEKVLHGLKLSRYLHDVIQSKVIWMQYLYCAGKFL